MNTILSVARKELRAWFLSPVALVFVATFLLATLFAFFWVEGFFARGVADARPLFQWLPVLLAFLVPALGMRLWSEEERSGTLELLQTWPLRSTHVVAGKFGAGLVLVAVALLLTVPVPLTVSYLGPLDWGPVFGGYLATLLLAGAYLSITLCISASTANPLVALGLSVLACGGLVVIGSEPVVGLFGHATGELLRNLGAGSRFDSILRGVLDLRDLAWFVSLTGGFAALNVLLIDARRWSGSERGRQNRRDRKLGLALLALNLLAFNLVLLPVHGARVDLTENHEYSVSDVTRELLEGLDEPLLIRGYFSAKTHPLLAPLVPRVRDLIEEYGAIGDQVRAEFVDPTTDPVLEKEAAQAYSIQPVPFQFADRHESSVVNSYFHVLVRYGDQSEVLDFEDLIEVEMVGMDVDVRLRNLEYDLTRAVQKTVYGFQSVESVAARLPDDATFTAYVSSELPEGFEEARGAIEAVVKELEARSSGRFSWSIVDPDAPGAAMNREQLYSTYGLKPLAVSLFGGETFYLHLLLQVGDRIERLLPRESLTEADIRDELLAALKRASGSGALKTVGLATPAIEAAPSMPGMPPMPPSGLTFNTLRQVLSETYAVTDVDLGSGAVPGDVDVLYVLNPTDFGDTERWALDQFLMRGGSAVVASGRKAISGNPRAGLAVDDIDSGLDEWLAGLGIEVGDGVVLDSQSASFPIPVTRDLGGFAVREIQMLRYPAFPDIRPDGFADGHPALAGLSGVVLHWPSPVTLKEGEGLPERTVLLSSTDEAWTLDTYDAQPNFGLYPDLGWRTKDERASFPLAVAATGPFDSFWKGKDAPDLGEETLSGGLIERSPQDARLVVVGSASFLADPVVDMARSTGDAWLAGVQLATNLVDWSLQDVELLRIRSRSRTARGLRPTSIGTRKALEWGNYGFAILAVVGIGVLSLNRRRDAAPMELDPPAQDGATAEKGAA